MSILQTVILVGSGSILSIGLLLWICAFITVISGTSSATKVTCNFALFFTGISGALLIWAFSLPV